MAADLDPKIVELKKQLSAANSRLDEAGKQWSQGGRNDLNRWTLHSKRVTIHSEIIAILEAMQRADPSYEAGGVAAKLAQERMDLKRSQESAEFYDPTT